MKMRDIWALQRRQLPSECSPEEARMRAAQYRQMAATASRADVRDALLRLASRYEGSQRPED
jgi:hypothetical protein